MKAEWLSLKVNSNMLLHDLMTALENAPDEGGLVFQGQYVGIHGNPIQKRNA